MRCKIISIKNNKHRYIGFFVQSSKKEFEIEKSELDNAIKSQCTILFNRNCKEMGIRLIKFEENKGIIKCNHIEKENTINLLKSIKKISSSKINIDTLGTSGTIKSLIGKHMSNLKKVQKQ